MNNNAILFTFTLIFVMVAFMSPIIANEYSQTAENYNTDGIDDDVGQSNIEYEVVPLSAFNIFSVLAGIFFWVFSAPVWLNLLLTVMRIIFVVIIYDKIRGI